ncbi:MAG: hypothetical protein HY717_17870 [Planctomycetes bacterium]|nr:hypothetical protein [Planctomycetota bacterium]
MNRQDAKDAKKRTERRGRKLEIWGLAAIATLAAAAGCFWIFFLRQVALDVDTLADPAVSPDGKLVAVVGMKTYRAAEKLNQVLLRLGTYLDDIDSHLYLVRLPDGIIQKTGIDVLPHGLSWRPDGSEICLISAAENDFSSLQRISVSGFSKEKVTSAHCFKACYSPSGEYLAYTQNPTFPNGKWNLVIESLPSGKRTRIIEDVDPGYICWHRGGKKVYYTNRHQIFEQDVESAQKRVLLSIQQDEDTWIADLVCSPDGSLLGFRSEGVFQTVDLETGEVTQLFEYHQPWLEFDWKDQGICYIDNSSSQSLQDTKLLVYRPEEERSLEVARGPITCPRWLDRSHILVRQSLNELWIYEAGSGRGKRIFPGPSTK